MQRRAYLTGLLVAALIAPSLLSRLRADPSSVLFVTGSTTLGLGDTAVKSRLEATGYVVEVRAATSPTLGDVTGKTVVLISSSAPAVTVGTTFRDTIIPVVTWQSDLFDDLRMTGAVSGTDFGTAPHYTEVVFPAAAPPEPAPENPRHPGSLTAALPREPGIITVTSAEGSFSWGKPAAAAWVAATLGVSSNAAIFAYEESDTMVGTPAVPAPARRVGLFMTTETAASLNDDGWKLFDAAVLWGTFRNTPPVVHVGGDSVLDPRVSLDIATSVVDDGLPYSKTKGPTFQWSKVSGPGVPLFSTPTLPNTTVTFPPPPPTDPYVIRLSASDGHLPSSLVTSGANDPDRQVIVQYENWPPVVSAAAASPVTLPGTSALSATATDEGLAGPLTYQWSKLAGPGNVTFGNANALNTTATFSTKGTYQLGLAVSDGVHTTPVEVIVEARGNALLVVGNSENTTGDAALKARLQNLGYTVTVKLSSAVQGSDATNRSVVVIAATGVDSSIAAKFKNRTEPVVVLKHSLFDDMAMTGATSGTHFGTSTSQTQVAIVAPANPLAAGLAGTVSTNSTPSTFTWGKPVGTAAVATLSGDGTRSTIFSYPAGTLMFGTFVAPGRRVGFFAQDAAANSLTPEGGWLFDAAVSWAAQMNRAPRAIAGPDLSVVLGNPPSVTLLGAGVDDGLPDPPALLTYSWTQPVGPLTAVIDSTSDAQPEVTFVDSGQYVFNLTVSDGSLSSVDSVTVNVSNPNNPPTVSISAQSPVLVSSTPTLTGVVSDDGLPQPPGVVTVTWSKLSGPGAVTFGTPGAATTTATFSKKGTYVLQLMASDGAASGSATVTIEARDTALLVGSGSANPTSGETYLTSRLNALSYEVTSTSGAALADAAAAAAAAAGKAVVVIGPSAVAGDVGTKFRTLTKPVVVLKEVLYDEMGMTTLANEGSTTGQRQVAIATPASAMAAGLTGTAGVAATSTFGWGIPNANGIKVATLASDGAKATVFGYPASVAMGGGVTVAARRVGFFARDDAPDLNLNANGRAMLDAAISWAATANLAPKVSLPGSLSAAAGVALSLPGSVFHDQLPTATYTAQWTKESGAGNATFGAANQPVTTVTLSAPGTYVLRLTANDGELSSFAEVTVSVSATNQAPVVNAGLDLAGSDAIVLPRSAQLAAVAYDDGQPAPLSVAWSKVAGPGTVTFASPASSNTTASFDATGRYVLRITANDGALTSYDDVTIDVGASAVLVTAAATVDPAEGRLVTRLESLGFGVTTVAAAGSSYSSADDRSLVLLSHLVVDTDVAMKFRTVAVPVIVTKRTLLDEMGMTTSHGTALSQTEITVALPSHAMAAGRSADPDVLNPAQSIGWGTGNPNVIKVATQVSQSSHATLMAYEKNTVMPGLTAPERRVGFLICLPNNLTPDGWAFFDAAVRWAIATNAPPRVTAGEDQTITLPATASLSGTTWDDGVPASPGLSSAWSAAAGPAGVVFDNPAALATTAHFTQPGTYVLKLTASDGLLEGSDQLTVNVLPAAPNAAPYVSAGTDQEVLLPNIGSLSGLVADDGLPGPTVTVSWTKVLGPGTVSFGSASSTTTTANFSVAGNYVLRLTATDSALQAEDEVSVVVQAAKTALIVNPASPTADDTANSNAISARLQGFGFTVTTAVDSGALAALANSRNLTIVTQNVDPVSMGTKLTNVTKPVIVARASVYPGMLMADSGVGEGTDFGQTSGASIKISDSALPLAAELSGEVTVGTQPTFLQWAANLRPTEQAAEIPGQPNQGSLFAYEKGEVMLASMAAPARRVGFFSSDATHFTADGWRLFDRSVAWATEPPAPALFVVSNLPLSFENKRMSIRLGYLGYSVTTILDNAVSPGDADGKALVVVSRSARSSVLGSTFRDVLVPVLTFDPENFSALGMSGSVLGDDYGFTPTQVSLSILDPAHALGAGLSGVQTVLTASPTSDIGWARPGPTADRIAVVVGSSYGATIFSYERGTAMPGLSAAPERRVGMYMNETVFGEYSDGVFTDAGWALFDAAVHWCGAADTDDDGLSNYEEFKAGTNPRIADTNGDGVPDGAQVGTDKGATNLDMDGDGVLNSVELQNGTDPFNRDTDGDGVLDGADCFPLDATRSTCPTGSDAAPPVIQLLEPTNATLVSSVP